MINRRNFLKCTSIVALSRVILPVPVFAMQNKISTSLPLPSLLDAKKGEKIILKISAGESHFIEGKTTQTAGVNAPFLGPVIKVRRGQILELKVINDLPEPLTLHWHGLKIKGSVDGGPHQIIPAGASWSPNIKIDQAACTCWFHPHQYPQTAELVMRGIAGMIIIEDDESDQFSLPCSWGSDDFPIIIQDRKFKENGDFDYELLDIVNVANGFCGDRSMVNGSLQPTLSCVRGFVRLRCLNGSNARSYQITTSDQRNMYIIASDGGLLDAPVPLKEFTILPGERYELIVDTNDGKAFNLFTLPVKQMGMSNKPFDKPVCLLSIVPNRQKGSGKLPTEFTPLEPLALTKVTKKRHFTLGMDSRLDKQAMAIMMQRQNKMSMPMPMKSKQNKMLTKVELMRANTINGKAFSMQRIDFDVHKGDLELWEISQGDDAMLHPFHVHGCQFRIISINDEAPPLYMRGWKDTVIVPPRGKCKILVQFNYLASKDFPYMAHCHILEHEDTGMMMQFTVSK